MSAQSDQRLDRIRYNAARRDTAIALTTAILLQWGMHVAARQVAIEVVKRLEKAGYLKALEE